MGSDKADVVVGDTTMLERVSAAMRGVVAETVLLGAPREGWETWPDSVHASGPLAGLATALGRTDRDRVLVLAVDHPFARQSTLTQLINVASDLPVVPVDEGGTRQVTFAVYPASIAAEAEEEARAGGSIQTLLDRVSFYPVTPEQWRAWGEDGRSWFSVDTPEALAEGLARY